MCRNFKRPDADKMHSKLLSDRMKYLKSTKEEVTKMCNIVEEYVAERVAEAKSEEAKNKDLSSIRTLMKNMHLSAEDAMSALDIPKNNYTRYLAML